MLALGAALSTSYATANASDYVSVTGIKFVDGGTPAAGSAIDAGLARHTHAVTSILCNSSAKFSARFSHAVRCALSGNHAQPGAASCRKRPC